MSSQSLKQCPVCGKPVVELVVFGTTFLCEHEVRITELAVSLVRHPCGAYEGKPIAGTVLYRDVQAKTLEREPRDPSLDEKLYDLARPPRRVRPDDD